MTKRFEVDSHCFPRAFENAEHTHTHTTSYYNRENLSLSLSLFSVCVVGCLVGRVVGGVRHHHNGRRDDATL